MIPQRSLSALSLEITRWQDLYLSNSRSLSHWIIFAISKTIEALLSSYGRFKVGKLAYNEQKPLFSNSFTLYIPLSISCSYSLGCEWGIEGELGNVIVPQPEWRAGQSLYLPSNGLVSTNCPQCMDYLLISGAQLLFNPRKGIKIVISSDIPSTYQLDLAIHVWHITPPLQTPYPISYMADPHTPSVLQDYCRNYYGLRFMFFVLLLAMWVSNTPLPHIFYGGYKKATFLALGFSSFGTASVTVLT